MLGAILCYVAVGFAPSTPVEGDDIAIAAGALHLSRYGDLDHGFDYRYDTQAATYVLVAALDRALGVPPMTGFALWTLAGFAAFFGFGTWLVARETQVPAPLAALVLLLFQESYVSAYYANSSMIAAGFLFAAVFLASKESVRSVLAAGGLFALAVLARFDAILMAPVLLIVLCDGERESWKRMILFTIVSAGVFLLLACAGGVSIARIWEESAGHAERFVSLKRTLMNYLTLVSGVGFLLWFVGLRAVVNERRWRLLLMSFAGWVPLVVIYGLTVTTPKYLLYGLPFFTLLVACGLKTVLEGTSRPAYRLRWICVILFTVQYVLGPLTVTSWALGQNVVVVGTHDGLRRLDAVGYVPLMWLRTKLHYQEGLAEAERILSATCDGTDNGLALTGDWFSSKWVSYQLLRAGYRCVESARHFDQIPIPTQLDFQVYAKGEKRMTTFQIEWVATAGASRDWRSRVRFDSFDSILLFSRLEDPGELLATRVSCEPFSKMSEFDRLPVFRIHPLPALPSVGREYAPPNGQAGAAQPEQKR
ncbi:MAG: hypothetical protein ABIP48_18475 [Planctomycetota bacterium]